MTYLTTLRARSPYCVLGSVLLLAALAALTSVLSRRTVAGTLPATQTADATRIMGVKTCRECHRPVAAAWQESRHAVNFDKLGDNPNAKKYAAALGIPEARDSRDGLCIGCHGQGRGHTEQGGQRGCL